MGDVPAEEPRRELKRAREALEDAEVLATGGGTDSAVIDRQCYAAFHGAQVVLYVRGYTPSFHGDVRRQVGQHVVPEDDTSRADGRVLGTLYDYRLEADGSGHPRIEVSDLRSEVEEFVAGMSALVREGG